MLRLIISLITNKLNLLFYVDNFKAFKILVKPLLIKVMLLIFQINIVTYLDKSLFLHYLVIISQSKYVI